MNKIGTILVQGIPPLLSISAFSAIFISIFSNSEYSLYIGLLTALSGLCFASISDLHIRRIVFIISQILGIAGGVLLILFGFQTWVVILVSLAFNPIPVARAVMLDCYHKHSTVLIIGISLLAQYIPWSLYQYFSETNITTIILLAVASMLIGVLITIRLRDEYDNKTAGDAKTKPLIKMIKSRKLMFTLLAFAGVEYVFYYSWGILEFYPSNKIWLSLANLGTVSGICLAMLYPRFPHLSIITLSYAIGAPMMLMALILCQTAIFPCGVSLFVTNSFYSIIGGVYLAFATDAVITMLGREHRAIGSAAIELMGALALLVANVIYRVVQVQSPSVFIVAMLVCLCSAALQFCAERTRVIIHHYD